MLKNVPNRHLSKQYRTCEEQPLPLCALSLLPSSHNKEDCVMTISPLKEDNSLAAMNTEITKENRHTNDLLLESLKQLKQDLESIKKEHMEKDLCIQQLRDELSQKHLQLEEVWQNLENSHVPSLSEVSTARDLQNQQRNKTAEWHDEEISQQILSIREIFAQQLQAIENLEAKRVSGVEDSTRIMDDYSSHRVDPFFRILKSFDEICHSNSSHITSDRMRDILSKIVLAMQQNLDYLEFLQINYNKYPEMVERYEVTVYEKDSIIECQQAIIAVKTEQIEKLQQQLEHMTLNSTSANESEIAKNNSMQKGQRQFALVHGLLSVVDNILSRLFGDRSASTENRPNKME
ncbi:hypothetical protein GpartN1_g596.t1 [Galdieria partita]|uniref:Uncharacterized protein n=1 Tax=Galdieria partita TaxID=83374 RepID=A0A9C7PQT8_9RHOD|nr:hypothetical protein GpartN1_g596.t1 [Galdieria partita]